MALWLHGCGNIESACLIAGTTRLSAPIGSTPLAGFLAILVVLPAVPDLFICAIDVFVAAMVWVIAPAGDSSMSNRSPSALNSEQGLASIPMARGGFPAWLSRASKAPACRWHLFSSVWDGGRN